MKKIIFSLTAVIAIAAIAFAQDKLHNVMIIHYNNGKEAKVKIENVEHVEFTNLEDLGFEDAENPSKGGTTDPSKPDDPDTDAAFRFEINVPDFSNEVNFSVYPDNKDYIYWVTMDEVSSFESFDSLEAYVEDDIAFWSNAYSDFASVCHRGDLVNASQTGLPNGAYVLIAYYYDAATGTAINPTVSEYFTIYSSSTGGNDEEPYLGLSYELDYGREGWDGLLGFPTTGKCIIVVSPNPNSAVAGWYYAIFSKANIEGAYSTDDAIRAELKSNEEFHNKNMQVYVKDFGTEWVLCGFWVDAQGNEGPIERIPFTASLNESANWTFVDYEGVWTVSGTNMNGNTVSYDITFEENVYNESFKVWGFTRTGNDRKHNAPVRVRYNNGVLEFYESSLLGIDDDDNWMGFNGFIDNPDREGAYASVNNNATIAKAVRDNNKLKLTWQNATINGYTVPFVAFSYGVMYDSYGEEYLMPYDEDMDYFIVKDMTITQKSMPGGMGVKAAPANALRVSMARKAGKLVCPN